MLGKKSRRREDKKPSRLEILLMKMETALEMEQFEDLPKLVEEFKEELERSLKGSFITKDTLIRFQKVLKHLEEKALKKKEELQKREGKLKKLKSYGDFG